MYNGHIYFEGWVRMYQYSEKQDDRKRRQHFLYIALISILPFLLFGFIGYQDWSSITAIDYGIGAFFYDLREPVRTTMVTGITRIADRSGQTLITIIAVILLMLFRKWWTGLWFGLTVLIGSDYLNDFVKNIFQRMRPDQIDHLVEQGEYAYPSGHAMGAMIIFGGLLFILIRYLRAKRQDTAILTWVLAVFFSLLILAIGLSRIYLGVHYPSDVIGGFSLGLAWLSLSIAAFGYPLTKREFIRQNKYRLNVR